MGRDVVNANMASRQVDSSVFTTFTTYNTKKMSLTRPRESMSMAITVLRTRARSGLKARATAFSSDESYNEGIVMASRAGALRGVLFSGKSGKSGKNSSSSFNPNS